MGLIIANVRHETHLAPPEETLLSPSLASAPRLLLLDSSFGGLELVFNIDFSGALISLRWESSCFLASCGNIDMEMMIVVLHNEVHL